MQLEGQQVTRKGDYVISTDKHNFINAGIMEARHSTDHRMVLAVLLREEALQNRRYRQRRTLCPIHIKSVYPKTEGGGVLYESQRVDLQDAATNKGMGILDIPGDLADI